MAPINKARQRKRRSSLPQGTNPVWTRFFRPTQNKGRRSFGSAFFITNCANLFLFYPNCPSKSNLRPRANPPIQYTEIRPFCPEFRLKSLSFLSFSEKCKNQGSFCKCLIIKKNAILHLPEVMGEDKKTLTIFSSLTKIL